VGAGIAYPQSTGALTFSGNYGLGFTQQNGNENDGIAIVTVVPPTPNSNSGSLSGVADSTSDVPTDTTPGIHSFSGAYVPYNPSNTNGCSNSPSVNVIGCFSSTISTGTAFSIPISPLPLDSYMIDQNHGFFVETDLVNPNNPSGQVSFGYYATQTLPVPPSNSSSRRRRR
jgi:hypothetical protein